MKTEYRILITIGCRAASLSSLTKTKKHGKAVGCFNLFRCAPPGPRQDSLSLSGMDRAKFTEEKCEGIYTVAEKKLRLELIQVVF